MNTTHNGIIDLSGWLKMPNNSLLRLIKTRSLQHSEDIAEQAVQLIVDGGYEESSIVSYTSEDCTITLHVLVEGEITQEYYDLTNNIDRAVGHV